MTPSEDEEEDLGGSVDLALLGRAVNLDASSLPTGDSAEPSALLKPLASFLTRCIESFGNVADCAFLFASDPEADFALLDEARRHSHLIRPRGRPYCPSGRVHMVATGGHRAASAPGAQDERDLLTWIKSNGLSDRPIAWYKAINGRIFWYPEGIERAELAVDVEVGGFGSITLASVDRALDNFYEKRCRLPDKSIPFWHDAPRRVPRRFAEKDIQRCLLQTLEALFSDYWVQREVPLHDSEVDFAIFGLHKGRQAALCVIEVKVLRAKRYNVDAKVAKDCPEPVNRKNLEDGIEQAAFAREELKVPLALVAAYDMRAKDDDGIVQALEAKSKALKVKCRRYFMFNSKRAYRKANVHKLASV